MENYHKIGYENGLNDAKNGIKKNYDAIDKTWNSQNQKDYKKGYDEGFAKGLVGKHGKFDIYGTPI